MRDRTLTTEEVKNLLENIEYYRLQKWMSRDDLLTKTGDYRLIQILDRYKYREVKTAKYVTKIAQALECTSEQLLVPLTKDHFSLASRDFMKEAVQKNMKGLHDIAFATKIPKERLHEVINLGVRKFSHDEILALNSMKFSLPTLASFANTKVDFAEIAKNRLCERKYSKISTLKTQQFNEFAQCEAILKQYAKEMSGKTNASLKFTNKETYDFYLALKQEWSNIRPERMNKHVIQDLITRVCSSKFVMPASVFFTGMIKSLPVTAAEIIGEEVKDRLDANAFAINPQQRPFYYFVNRAGSHVAKFGLLLPKAIEGALSTPILGDNPPYTLLNLPMRTIDNFVIAKGYSQTIVNDWKEALDWTWNKINPIDINTMIPRVGFFPNQAPTAIYNTDSLYRYRGDSRHFNDIFSEGFRSRGNNTDLLAHFKKHQHSGYIATSDSLNVASRFPTPDPFSPNQTYVYEIAPKRPGIHLEKKLAGRHLDVRSQWLLVSEGEYSFRSKIAPNEIRGCWPVNWVKHGESLYLPSISDDYIINPNATSALQSKKIWNANRLAGPALSSIGLAVDGYGLYQEYEKSRATGNYDNTYRKASEVAGGWAGAATTGALFAKAGAIACAPFTPIASASCAAGAGLVGSIYGYHVGSKVATEIYDKGIPNIILKNAVESTTSGYCTDCSRDFDDFLLHRMGDTPSAKNRQNLSNNQCSNHS